MMQALITVYVFFLPGTLLTALCVPALPFLVRIIVGMGVGIAIVPIAAFAVALICNTVISIGLLLIIATGINGLALLVLFLQYKKV